MLLQYFLSTNLKEGGTDLLSKDSKVNNQVNPGDDKLIKSFNTALQKSYSENNNNVEKQLDKSHNSSSYLSLPLIQVDEIDVEKPKQHGQEQGLVSADTLPQYQIGESVSVDNLKPLNKENSTSELANDAKNSTENGKVLPADYSPEEAEFVASVEAKGEISNIRSESSNLEVVKGEVTAQSSKVLSDSLAKADQLAQQNALIKNGENKNAGNQAPQSGSTAERQITPESKVNQELVSQVGSVKQSAKPTVQIDSLQSNEVKEQLTNNAKQSKSVANLETFNADTKIADSKLDGRVLTNDKQFQTKLNQADLKNETVSKEGVPEVKPPIINTAKNEAKLSNTVEDLVKSTQPESTQVVKQSKDTTSPNITLAQTNTQNAVSQIQPDIASITKRQTAAISETVDKKQPQATVSDDLVKNQILDSNRDNSKSVLRQDSQLTIGQRLATDVSIPGVTKVDDDLKATNSLKSEPTIVKKSDSVDLKQFDPLPVTKKELYKAEQSSLVERPAQLKQLNASNFGLLSATATTQLVSAARADASQAPLTYTPVSETTQQINQVNNSHAGRDLALPVSMPRPLWNQRFAEHISMLTLKGASHARIRLDPPELGPMAVRIQTQGGETQIQFTVTNPIARDLVDSGMQRLRDMLEEHGFGKVDVDINEFKQDDNAKDNGHELGPDLDLANVPNDGTEQPSKPQPLSSYRDSIGIIDIFA